MNASSGAPSAPSLTVQTVNYDHSTRITLLGRADSTNRRHLLNALPILDTSSSTTVELSLAHLDYIDVDTVTAMLVFAEEVHDKGGKVVIVDATPFAAAMFMLLDVRGVVNVARPDADGGRPAETLPLLHLLRALSDHGAA